MSDFIWPILKQNHRKKPPLFSEAGQKGIIRTYRPAQECCSIRNGPAEKKDATLCRQEYDSNNAKSAPSF